MNTRLFIFPLVLPVLSIFQILMGDDAISIQACFHNAKQASFKILLVVFSLPLSIMAYKNQQQFIETLEKAGELIRIKTYVDPKLEMAEITDRMSKQPGGGKALLFENSGYDFPVLMNAYGSEKRMCMALGVEHLG